MCFFFQVIEGLLQAHPSVITSREHCAQLLGHEASRVLHDRLTNDTDRRYFYKVLSEQLHNGFKTGWTPEELEKNAVDLWRLSGRRLSSRRSSVSFCEAVRSTAADFRGEFIRSFLLNVFQFYTNLIFSVSFT